MLLLCLLVVVLKILIRYGVIYASGGKNLGPSGFVTVIVRRDLLARAQPRCPSILSWKAHAETKPIPNIYNTPPVINLWLHELTLAHYEKLGGMAVLAPTVQRRKDLVYGAIDGSGFYHMPVSRECRSAMSVSMTIVLNGKRREDLEKLFVEESTKQGMIQLFGHPVKKKEEDWVRFLDLNCCFFFSRFAEGYALPSTTE